LGTRQLVTFLRAKSAKHGYCWWKQKTIAEEMERGLRTVNRQIGEAIAAGLVRSERHGHGNYYTPCDLIEKVAYRAAAMENAVEKTADRAAVGASDTPNRRIAAPPISITEILKPEKNLQSESAVQEHPEPAIAVTEPSPFEKAQIEAIANAVRACGFEPTPELIAKLERKRRHYGATGFRIAAAIARAFKLVEGTSNTPQKLPWFTTVVENALRHTEGTAKQHGAAGEVPAIHRVQRTPAPPVPPTLNLRGPMPELVADVDQVDDAAVAHIEEPAYDRPADDPVVGSQRDARELSVEDRRLLAEARRIFPFAPRENLLEAVAEMRAAKLHTVEKSAAAVDPRPPQRELCTPHEITMAAAAGTL
jgi:hypothetical protein